MLWRRSDPPLFTPSTAPVPDAESLRRAALQASWQRGRWVARRRVAQRWLVWVTVRYLFPAVLVSGAALWVWQDVLPNTTVPWQSWARWAGLSSDAAAPIAQEPTQTPVPVQTATPAATPPAPETEAPTTIEYSPEGEALPTPVRLRLDTLWGAAAQSAASPGANAPAAPSAESLPLSTPQLKPENWLHSKEP